MSIPLSAAAGNSGQVTLIHIGDIHGHLIARPNLRSDGTGRMEGGVARMYTKIQEIRHKEKNSLLINTGDTIQGSAEAMFTRGDALIEVLNHFKIDVFTPGNWEFVYGTERFLELFAGPSPKAPWNAVSANLYYSSISEDPTTPYPDKTGLFPSERPNERVIPPYVIKNVGGLKIGVLGFTTDRGPQVVGKTVVKGFKFSKGDAEIKEFIKILRTQEKVDLLVMISELGLANNIRLAEANEGVDVILSSDMHEVTRKPVVTKTGTIIVEEGQDGTVLGELRLTVDNGKLKNWDWKFHTIDTRIPENEMIAKEVMRVRKSFVAGPDFKQHVNPFNGTLLPRPIDTVVGNTQVALHRSNFSHENMPAVIEGSSHDFLTDAFRAQGDTDIGALRGFRYGTHVPPGPIKMEDLYHFIPIGPMIARGNINGKTLVDQIENAADGSLNPAVNEWTGGWLFNFSGVTMDINPYAARGARAANIKIFNRKNNAWEALKPEGTYSYAAYYYTRDPDLINVIPATDIKVLKDEKGANLDGVEVVVRYLQSLPNKTVNPTLNRIRLVKPLPADTFGNPEIQPWRGVTPAP
ncbi:MAG: 5'-nucleotidase C-terminal domain-containing protein [Gammaproteobacteria bacterium]|nr:5'-nucleotidase C-terminal domain-containing protein [Gammaproteobacteria bacterium]